jgi:hypothetical protein
MLAEIAGGTGVLIAAAAVAAVGATVGWAAHAVATR